MKLRRSVQYVQDQNALSRRKFLSLSALGIGGALVVGTELVPGAPWTDAAAAAATVGGSIGVYVTINPDGTVTVICPGAEAGQGISTALPMIVAEELMVDWSNVRVQLAGADSAFNRPTSETTLGTSQSTGGSNSVRSYHDYLRNVGATARQKLIWAASSMFAIPVSDLKAVNGTVVRVSTGALVATYPQLAATAVSMSPNDVAWVKPPYRYIGSTTLVARKDIPLKVNGSAQFGIDVRLPGMLYASVKQPPKVGQTVGTVGKAPTGTSVVLVPMQSAVPGEAQRYGVAVVTSTTSWQAVQAVRSLNVTWVDAPYTASVDSDQIKARAADLMVNGTATTAPGAVGDANTVLAAAPAGQRFAQTYSVPYVPHTPLEPMNCTVLTTDTGVEMWVPTQVQTRARQAAQDAISLATSGAVVMPLSSIKVNNTFLGGGFGRRLEVDFIRQAVTVAWANKGKPVKLMWAREEDLTHDFYRQTSTTRLEASVDATGAITAFKGRVVAPSASYQKGTLAAGAVDNACVDGLANVLYGFPNRLVEWVQDPTQVPLGSWRSVGNSQNCFFVESFLDEVAVGTGQDPIALRRKLLSSGSAIHQRALKVLDQLVLDSGWNTPPASGTARGMALSMSFGNTIVGEVVEISGSLSSSIRVRKVFVVVDPGSVVNRDTVKAQMESAVIMGLSVALFDDMPFAAGEPLRKNFDRYRMMRMREVPAISTTIIESGAPLGGIGEPGLPPAAPALVNAIARLTGTRVRSLPVFPQPLPPTITGFTPASGPAGTVVAITGKGLTGATAVTFNGKAAAAFTVNGDTQVTATAPSGVATGPIRITNASGTATSSSDFTASASGPAITGFSPASGTAGTVVTITGSGFTGASAVTFNGVPATTFTVDSATQIRATSPAGTSSGPIAVTTPAGTATSATTFSVMLPAGPVITGFSPSSGTAGTVVTITGSGFTGASAVTFNGSAAASFTVVNDGSVTATAPSGVTAGPLAVSTLYGTGTSATSFTVASSVPVPKVTGFTPSSGGVGTAVTLTGSGFTAASSVQIGSSAAAFTLLSDTSIVLGIPSGATTGKISVTTTGGTGSTSGTFSVGSTKASPSISSISPTSGPAGTKVTVKGSNVGAATAAAVSGKAATYAVTAASTVVVTVPSGATTGKVSVTTPGGTASSGSKFTVA